MIDRAAALAALRRELDGAAFDQATVLEVRDAGPDGFVVRVRWARRHPTYAIVVPADAAGLGTDLFTGGEHDGDAAEWAMFVRYWLMEELDFGLVSRTRPRRGAPARRPRPGGGSTLPPRGSADRLVRALVGRHPVRGRRRSGRRGLGRG